MLLFFDQGFVPPRCTAGRWAGMRYFVVARCLDRRSVNCRLGRARNCNRYSSSDPNPSATRVRTSENTGRRLPASRIRFEDRPLSAHVSRNRRGSDRARSQSVVDLRHAGGSCMIDPVRLGLIGCGHWGSNYAASIVHIDDATLSWCADTSDAALARVVKLHPRVRLTPNLHELVAADDCDAIIVAAPPIPTRCHRPSRRSLRGNPFWSKSPCRPRPKLRKSW